jgi:hypothetical protein
MLDIEALHSDPRYYPRKTLRFPDGKLSYHYTPAGKDGLGRTVWFCWSCHRNMAGYFLGWREVRSKKGGKRDRFIANRTRKRLVEIAGKRAADRLK